MIARCGCNPIAVRAECRGINGLFMPERLRHSFSGSGVPNRGAVIHRNREDLLVIQAELRINHSRGMPEWIGEWPARASVPYPRRLVRGGSDYFVTASTELRRKNGCIVIKDEELRTRPAVPNSGCFIFA